MATVHLLLISVFIANRDLTPGCIDQYIGGLRKHWSSLNVVIAEETKVAMLREGSSVIVDRTIFESVDKSRYQTPSVDALDQIACRYQLTV